MQGKPKTQTEDQDFENEDVKDDGGDNTARPPGDWQVEPKPFPDPDEITGTPVEGP